MSWWAWGLIGLGVTGATVATVLLVRKSDQAVRTVTTGAPPQQVTDPENPATPFVKLTAQAHDPASDSSGSTDGSHALSTVPDGTGLALPHIFSVNLAALHNAKA